MKRVLTALVLIPPVLYLIFFSPQWAVLLAASIVAVLCFHEYQGIVRAQGIPVFGPFGYVAGLLLMLPSVDTPLSIILFGLLALSLSLRSGDLREALPRSAGFVFGLVYIFGAWRFAPLLRLRGPHWLAFALALNWIGDAFAYYGGKSFGRHKLAPVVSPSKTWEGAVCSLAGSTAFGVFYLGLFVPSVPLWQRLLLSILGNVAGQIGDLAESAIKRGAGVKDSGNLLPGHGGWLDRVDSTIFCLPVIYGALTLLASLERP